MDELLLEKIEANFRDWSHEEPKRVLDYNPHRRMDAIEVLLGQLEGIQETLHEYEVDGNAEEKRYAKESGALSEMVSNFIDVLANDMRECEEDLGWR